MSEFLQPNGRRSLRSSTQDPRDARSSTVPWAAGSAISAGRSMHASSVGRITLGTATTELITRGRERSGIGILAIGQWIHQRTMIHKCQLRLLRREDCFHSHALKSVGLIPSFVLRSWLRMALSFWSCLLGKRGSLKQFNCQEFQSFLQWTLFGQRWSSKQSMWTISFHGAESWK